MIILEFRLDDRVIQEDREAGFPDKAALLETYFVLPVRFSLDNVELFENISPQLNYFEVDTSGNAKIVARNIDQHVATPWLYLPILGFGINCFQRVKEACMGSKSIYEMPGGIGYLCFIKVNDRVKINFTYNGKNVETNCSEIIEAFIVFRNKVKELAERTFPEFAEDLTWRSFFD